MNIFTMGFTKKSAEKFFALLKSSGAKRIVDVRLNNISQLTGFTKRDDLAYFLGEMIGLDYIHLPELAPTKKILADYRKNHRDWNVYEKQFLKLMQERSIEKHINKEIIKDGCLLCSEDKPHHCHRRLVAEYLRDKWADVEIVHL